MHTLDQLIAFAAVYEKGSYSAAARKLSRDRATVREHVLSFEDNLGYALFEIEGRKAIPTHRARQLYPKVRILIQQNEQLILFGQAFFNDEPVSLTILHDTSVPRDMLHAVEQQALQHFPQLQLSWLNRNRHDTLRALIDGEAGLGIALKMTQVQPEKELDFTHLGTMPIVPYVSPKSPYTQFSQVRFSELITEPQYILEDQLSTRPELGVSSQLRVVSHFDTAVSLLGATGWTALPKHIAQPYIAQDKLVELSVDAATQPHTLELNLFYRQGMSQSSTCTALINWIKQEAQRHLS
ncbi:LysR family transcriptional regulator [Ferrimonas pelagia]|uniref:LysR family transcriptional regulator n=1 Tax=Ferrimonas pelagia TaxID=1177826 RepID=A0ABP9FH37_9GAMM